MHHPMTHQGSLPVRGRILAVLLAAAFTLASLATAAPVLATTRGDGLRAEVNSLRASKGLPKVVGTSLLDDITDKRADQMRDADKLEHDMDYVRNRLVKSGVCWTSFGEIIAYNSRSPYSYAYTVNQWWNSDPHRAIMLGSFNAAGGSWASTSSGRHYSVMVFVNLCSSELTKTSLLQPKWEYSPDRPMVFSKGTHTAYKFSSTGAVLDKKTVTFSARTRAESTGRAKLGGKAFLKVTTGPLAGYWVRESPKSFVRGMTEKRTFASPVRLSFEAGTYTGRQYDKLGRVTSKKTYTLSRASGADAAARAVINGRRQWLVKNGIWGGYWVRDTAKVNRAG
ncbi:MAG TPA: CAP domain-containing protein [Candidatus Limnocylindria bacterium]